MSAIEIAMHFLSEQFADVIRDLESPRYLLAYLAALIGIALITAGAFARTMMPLRWFAAGSNVGMAVFGVLDGSYLTLLIAVILLPVNVFRAVEVTRLSRRVSRATVDASLSGLWLRPYMKAFTHKSGQTLFHKGETADRLYLLVDGQLFFPEIQEYQEVGRIFGEIGLFSPAHLRTISAQCESTCTVLEIHATTVRQLFYQNPAFGFHLMELLASHLSEDVSRLEEIQPARQLA